MFVMHIVLAQATANTNAGAGGAVIGTVVWLAITVVMIVAVWKLFAKAGKPGWASLIPIYNTVTLLHITGRSGWWLLGFMVPFLNLFVIIRLVFDLARVFGRGVGFGFGLLFLFPIFLLILAFGDAAYVGPNGDRHGAVAGDGYASAPLAP
jgi:hypothetical protein